MNKNNKTSSAFTFGIFDNFEGKLRLGFASDDIKKMAIEVAGEVVDKSLAAGESTFAAYENKTIRFKDALDIFEDYGFVLAIVPNYMELLLKEGVKTVVSTSPESFFDGSNEGVKLLKIHYGDGAEVVVKYYEATDPDMVLKGVVDIPNLASEVTWKQAIDVMKKIQEKHQIDLFAPGYFKTCSCCATPKDFPEKHFLNKEDANSEKFVRKDGSKIKSVILANAYNISGAPKFKNKKGSEVFGMLTDGLKTIHQFVHTYHLSTEETKLVLEDFVNGLNDLVGEETYSLEFPEEEGYAFGLVIKR